MSVSFVRKTSLTAQEAQALSSKRHPPQPAEAETYCVKSLTVGSDKAEFELDNDRGICKFIGPRALAFKLAKEINGIAGYAVLVGREVVIEAGELKLKK